MSNLLLNLYKKMYLIREAELEICREYPNDEMKTPMHMSLGEEAIVAGVCQALPGGSHGYGTYRSHGLYLAWTEETDKFFAELYGKATGTAGGRAGSMHLASPDHGLMATSAVVGTTIPLAIGDAFEAVYTGKDRITAVFFGDGATDEGSFWESLNAACLWRLPILFVCEDNDLAIHIPTSRRRGYNSLFQILTKFRLSGVADIKITDTEQIHMMTKAAVHFIREYKRPYFMNIKYYRCLEHVGVNNDFDYSYRSKEELSSWDDPIEKLRTKIIGLGHQEKVEEIEEQIRNQVLASRIKAQNDSFPESDSLSKGVFCEN